MRILSVLRSLLLINAAELVPVGHFQPFPPSPICQETLSAVLELALGLEPNFIESQGISLTLNSILAMLSSQPGGDVIIGLLERILSAVRPSADGVSTLLALRRRLHGLAPEEQLKKNSTLGMHGLVHHLDELEVWLRSGGFVASPRKYASAHDQAVEMVSDSAQARLSSQKGSHDPQTWLSFLQSPMLVKLVTGLFDQPKMTAEMTGLSLPSPMKNFGKAFCDGSAASGLEGGDFVCAVQSVLGWMMGCEGSDELSCPPQDVPSVPMTVCTKSGADVDPVTELVSLDWTEEAEYRTGYWLLRAAQNLYASALNRYPCGEKSTNPAQLLPGWNLLAEYSVNEPGSNLNYGAGREESPIAQLLEHSQSACDLALIFRGTTTDYEWLKDYQATLVPLSGNDDQILVHNGFLELTTVIRAPLEAVLGEKMESCPHLNLTLSGHSLGGACANVLATSLLSHWAQVSWEQLPQVDLNVITFAPPRSMNRQGRDLLARATRVRTYTYELDAIPLIPCSNAGGNPRCDSRSTFANWGEGEDIYAEHLNLREVSGSSWDPGNRTLWQFSHSTLSASAPLFGGDSWGEVVFYPLFTTASLALPPPLQLAKNHICAYSCYFSLRGCIEDPKEAWDCSSCE